jgi:hypothetical protein
MVMPGPLMPSNAACGGGREPGLPFPVRRRKKKSLEGGVIFV